MWNPMNLSGRTILVTGASSGLGRACSVLLSRLGATPVLAGRNPEQLQATADLLEGRPHRIERFDLGAPEAIGPWLKGLAQETGVLAGLVHSAGLQTTRPLRLLSVESVDELMRVNFAAAVQLIKGFRQRGVCAAPASVVFLSSIMGIVGQPGVAAYAASKGALIALTKSLALELAPEKIRVNCVAPGHVRTEMAQRLEASLTPEQFQAIEKMHPLGLGRPEDVANAVAFLLADTGRWITGTTLVVDGGYTAH
jgi:NAD(P)-dependent dehydrogenase (short-subunit alcohol dehydrogenase family)